MFDGAAHKKIPDYSSRTDINCFPFFSYHSVFKLDTMQIYTFLSDFCVKTHTFLSDFSPTHHTKNNRAAIFSQLCYT